MRRKRRLKRLFISITIFVLVAGAGIFIIDRAGIVEIETMKAKAKSLSDELRQTAANLLSGKNQPAGNCSEEASRIIYEEGFYYEKLSEEIKSRITGKTFPEEFPQGYTAITYDDLRYVKVSYYDFDGNEHHDGELIVHKDIAQDTVEIFYELYINKYQFTSIKLADDFYGSDEKSMAANNTSAFNYRLLENEDELSWHCFGLAIDINPMYNPYILDGKVYPENGVTYADREKIFPGKIDKNDIAYEIFTEHGFLWGGTFEGSPDYQHFYRDDIVDYAQRQKNR